MYPPPPPPPSPPHNSATADLTRYISAVDSQPHHPPPPPHHRPNLVGHYTAGDSSSFGLDSGNSNGGSSNCPRDSGLQRSYGFNETEEEDNSGGGVPSSSLFRHRSSPPGFFNQPLPTDPPNGFSLGRPSGGYGGGERRQASRSKAELSFAAAAAGDQMEETTGINGGGRSSVSFGHPSWDASSSSANISFTIDHPAKRSKTTDFFTLQTQFSMPQTSLEMARMDNLLNIPEDAVPCRIRAKRGCATHPRSIAERERRTRISGKLKKLQELVPNMDKQTSYADMLDLAVDHIRGLQYQVEKLQKEMEKCSCGACKR